MALPRTSRRTAVLFVVLMLAGAVALGAPAAAEAAAPARAVLVSTQGPGFTQVVCDIVKSQGVGAAASALLSQSGSLIGALLGQVVVTAIQNNCARLIERGIKVVRSILATIRPPRAPPFSPRRTYLDQLTALRVNHIGSRLGTSGQYVVNARDAVCRTVERNQDAATVIARLFPRARLVHLDAMNAFIRLVVDSCRGLDRADANFITGAVLNLVLANQYQRDLDPPVVQIYRSATQRPGGRRALVTASFRWFDSSGVRDCDILLWYHGTWHRLSGTCSTASALLAPGTKYAWAFRATDTRGHVSQWAVTYMGTA